MAHSLSGYTWGNLDVFLSLCVISKTNIMQCTYLGHSSFLIKTSSHTLLVDPFITGNPLASDKVDIHSLKPDYILLTHGHGDHTADAEVIALSNGSLIIANFEVSNWFGDRGCQTFALNTGGKKQFDFGTAKMVSATHSSTLPDGSDGGSPNGFLLEVEEKVIYIAGDTGLNADMALIPKYFARPDIAILPMGDVFTMGYEDALIAAQMVETKRVIACHFDTFEPIQINHNLALSAFESKNIQLILPEINQVITI